MGVGWGLVAIVAVAILAAWTDLVLELSPALRMGALAVALLAGLALAIVTAAEGLAVGDTRLAGPPARSRRRCSRPDHRGRRSIA